MSKAFTREDHDGPAPGAPRGGSTKPPVSALGARVAREKLADVDQRRSAVTDVEARALLDLEHARLAALADARVAPSPERADVAAFGAQVRLRDEKGRERVVAIVSADEVGLVPHAASVTSPIAHALVGARAGDVVELGGPRGVEELTVVEVRFP